MAYLISTSPTVWTPHTAINQEYTTTSVYFQTIEICAAWRTYIIYYTATDDIVTVVVVYMGVSVLIKLDLTG